VNREQRVAVLKLKANKRLTDFEKRVLLSTVDIPSGETRSYKWIAVAVGNPGAARAVGRALGKNPYAPVVPCHRVVRSDGTLGGYSPGVEMKMRLLGKEGVRIKKDDNGISRIG
jgi:O-6-methylguanine DNA methyltransferase